MSMGVTITSGAYLGNVDPSFVQNKKPKSKERNDRRIRDYHEHHKSKEPDHSEFAKTTVMEEIRQTHDLRKKYLETKSKKNKKEKSEKSKKVDVLPVAAISDENRLSNSADLNVHSMRSTPVGSVLPPVTPQNSIPHGTDPFHTSSTPSSSDVDDFLNSLNNGDDFPDLIGGALDFLGGEISSDGQDITNTLDLMSQTMSDPLREQMHALEAEAVKYENSSPSIPDYQHSVRRPGSQKTTPSPVYDGYVQNNLMSSPNPCMPGQMTINQGNPLPSISGPCFMPQNRNYSNLSDMTGQSQYQFANSSEFLLQNNLPTQSSRTNVQSRVTNNTQYYPPPSYQPSYNQPVPQEFFQQQSQPTREMYQTTQQNPQRVLQARPMEAYYQVKPPPYQNIAQYPVMQNRPGNLGVRMGNTISQVSGYPQAYAIQQPMRTAISPETQQPIRYQYTQASSVPVFQNNLGHAQPVYRSQQPRGFSMEPQQYVQQNYQQTSDCFGQNQGSWIN